jgi:2-dehydropantoate 2-reductase
MTGVTDRPTGSVAVVGCGALGGVFAGLLSAAGMDVTVVVRSGEQRKEIAAEGLRMLENGRETRLRLRVCAELPPQKAKESFDLVLILVKAFDTDAVAAHLAGRIPPDTPVLTLQNGLGNAEALAARLKPGQILAGVTTFGALRESAGAVRLTGRGECVIGAWHREAERHTRPVAELLSNAGIPCTASPHVLPVLWKKLAVSAVINPLTAILRIPNGELLQRPELDPLMAEIAEEVWRVAARHRIPLPTPPELVEEVHRVCRGTASNRSSMLRDVEEGRPTEIGSINAAVVRLGRERGALAPANQALASLVLAISQRAGKASP